MNKKTSYIPLIIITLAHLMAVLDNTVMVVALPSIQQGLAIPAADRQWIITAYTLAYAGLLLLGGKLADRFGANRTLLVGVAGFALASAVGGAAQTGWMLIAARAVEGCFGAVLTSSTKTLLALTYTDGQQRARAMGVFSATLALGGVLGMVLGGFLTAALSWRWCLYINLPLSVLVLAGSAKYLPRLATKPQVHINILDALIFCAAIIALVFGLGQAASDGWTSPVVLSSLAACILFAALFILKQARGKNPLFPLRIITQRHRAGAFLSMIFNSFGTLGLMLVLTFQLQSQQGASPLTTGLAMMPLMAVVVVISALVVPKLIPRVAPGLLIFGGLLFSALGLLPLVWLPHTAHLWPLIITSELLEGIGTGLGSAPAMHTSLLGVLPQDVGIASSTSSAASQIGSSLGAALLNTLTISAASAAAATTPLLSAQQGYASACGWGCLILMVAAFIVIAMIRLSKPQPMSEPSSLSDQPQAGQPKSGQATANE